MLEIIFQPATIIGVVGAVLAYVAWRQSRKTFHQTVIVSCTTRFQNLSAKLRAPDPADETVQQYLELCNEELFYFEQKYLPQGIIDEWVEGMVSLIGVWCGGQCLLPTPPPTGLFFKKAEGFPRVCYAFTLSPEARQRVEQAARHQPRPLVDARLDDLQRAQAVLEVLANLRNYQQQPFYAYLSRHRRAAQQDW